MNVTEQTLALAADLADEFEGFSLVPYHDPVGFPTIGFGHLLSRRKWADLAEWEPLPDREAGVALLERDMRGALASVRRLIVAPLEIHQEAALADFAFNCGAGNLQISTLRRKVNRREYAAAADEFPRWKYAAGRLLKGLVRRRAAERHLFLYGSLR